MSNAYFVAGTDTGVGKTWVSCRLLEAAGQLGKAALGLKPVAAGAELEFEGSMENEDAVALKKASTISIGIRELNPVCLPAPLSPHIAAKWAGAKLDVTYVKNALAPGLSKSADLCLIEGAGGWRVPINDTETMADLAVALKLPVILVIGLRLGCLNHALLTAEAIKRDGLKLFGWVANELSINMTAVEENVATLKRQMPAPMLARVPYSQNFDVSVGLPQIDINKLLNLA